MYRIMGREELRMLKRVIQNQDLCRLNQFKKGKSFATQFEEEFERYLGIKYALIVNSGSAALQTAVAACDIGPGDEVICTAFSYISSSGCVLNQNAIPVFADVDPKTFCIDPADIEKKITERTKAIIPVHIFGQPCDMDSIMDIAKRHNLYVIEDCCQAYGSKYKGKMVGTIGHLACFSLQQSKHITCGDGGIVVSNDEKLIDKAGLFANYGQYVGQRYNHLILGWNFRPSELQSAVALAQLRKIERFNQIRRKAVQLVNETLRNLPQVEFPKVPEETEPNWWFYPLKYKEGRISYSEFKEHYQKERLNKGVVLFGYISNRPNYLEPVYKERSAYKNGCPFDCKWYSKRIEYREGLCPVLEEAMKNLLLIDTHPLNFEKVKSAVKGIKKILS